MIHDPPESHFIFLYHPDVFSGATYTLRDGRPMTNGEVLAYWGKWIVLADRDELDRLARELDPFVEDRSIPCIKYDRRPSQNLGVSECVMMVYCDRRDRDAVWAVLEAHGVRMKAWVTERETMEMWIPGSPLLERWLDSVDAGEEFREAVREDARQRLSRVFGNPDEVFSPWAQ